MTLGKIVRSMRSAGEKALVPFFTAGYPDEETFLNLLKAAACEGCRVIEVGVPFSDPIADGPAIQESSRLALERGMTLARALSLVEAAGRAQGTGAPAFVVMGYVNPVLSMGPAEFAEAARGAGVTGAVMPDVPFEESAEMRNVLRQHDVAFIDLVAPTTTEPRMERIVEAAEGFVYLVSVTGVTGSASPSAEFLEGFAGRVREKTDAPLYVGFGISDPAQAGRAARCCDGVIVGSALVRLVRSARSGDEAVGWVRSFLERARREMGA